ncbi:Hansenula MRAKII killer toxin-resistant protein 1 [Actinoplanes sp. KI2]|uniref:Hansenula MRAKII killer toxin-resistant protein 1 n=1 Tax=Actinoplanes sp. KI2 TaxID=2983315 RepID=UPI0021D5D7C6|nr:Hansenula MRAKII killer toxin-resistant protein 1 [Actinoplanes sp. KI2]MCU7729773.1 Hansenula MRAKII killer toxin-resistant protein 1 [Actinoplanes sp. KI2]
MADKGWTGRVATAAGVAAGTGAAQLGLGYGLGVIVWPVTVAEDRSEWLGSLGWATWITASATVFGAVIASRLGGAQGMRARWPWRLALAISAGVGALVAVALIALPARAAVRLDAHSPQLIAAGYALLGVALGVVVAFWAVWSRPVAANLVATAAWLWALAITAIVVELVLGRETATYLTSWQFVETSATRYGVIYWPSALLTLTAAFAIGLIAVIPAVRRGDVGLGAAISGAVGPLLVAVSFLALSPRLTGTPGPIESAYLIAPYAVLSGLAGSALAVAVAKSFLTPTGEIDTIGYGEPAAGSGDDEPTEQLPAGTKGARARTPESPSPATGRATPKPAPRPEPTPSSTPKPSPVGTSATRSPDALTDPPKAPKPVTEPPKAPTPLSGHPGAQRMPSPRAEGKPDPEIAAAARPGRLRGKKGAPIPEQAEPESAKSRVTPPPTAPTVAQINPKRPTP